MATVAEWKTAAEALLLAAGYLEDWLEEHALEEYVGSENWEEYRRAATALHRLIDPNAYEDHHTVR